MPSASNGSPRLWGEVAAAERAAVFAPEAPAAPTMYLGVDGSILGWTARGCRRGGPPSPRESKLVVI